MHELGGEYSPLFLREAYDFRSTRAHAVRSRPLAR
jgi:hypothetical protein